MALKFGTSGVRGLVTEMTDSQCRLYTKAFVRHLKTKSSPDTISLAGDLRSSTPKIKKAIAYAIREEGVKVNNCGDIPTGAVTMHGMANNRASIMVTGSHIPDDRNGIKFNMPRGEILKDDEAMITGLYEKLKDTQEPPVFDKEGNFKSGISVELTPVDKEASNAYVDRYINFFPYECLKGLKIVFYQHSAVGREILLNIFNQLGAEVINVGLSDRFVAVDTEAFEDPELLSGWVTEHKADALISTDGDSDRPLLVDENGKIVRGDVLGIIVADFLNADSVSAPISCNTALEKCNKFINISRTRIGSPYVISSMNEAVKKGLKTVVGYEANGGFLTATDILSPESGKFLKALPTRDAALPLIAALLSSATNKKSISEITGELPPRYTMSGIIRDFPNELGKNIIEKFKQKSNEMLNKYFIPSFGAVESINFTDGVRITFSNSDIVHLRPSGNAPEFRCYTESSVESRSEEINQTAIGIIRDRMRPE